MKLAIFHLAAYVVVGVVLAEEKEKPEGFNPMYWLDDRMTEMFNPTALAKPGDECTVAIIGLIPDPVHFLPTYTGEAQLAAVCYDGIPVFGNSFHTDANARAGNYAYLKDELSCCIHVKCGPDFNGYCNSRGVGCKDLGFVPLATSNCPGSNSQCCPTPPQLKSDASIGYDDNPFVPGEAAASDITGSGDPGIGNPDEDIAFGMDTPPEGSLNPDDWPAVPLDSENLFLSSDDTDNYGLVAGLEDSMGEGFDHTG